MFQELLTKLARELKTSDIPYMVIGGQAVLLYGEPRLTRDIDVTLGIGPDNLKDILSFGVADATPVHFASLEDIVIHKIIAGRPRDIEDIISILLKNPAYDDKYISSWLEEFDKGLDTRYLELFRSLITDLKR